MLFEKLDRKIVIEKVTRTFDAQSNETIEAWSSHKVLYAQKKGLKGSENFTAGSEVSKANCLWYVRYFAGLNAQDYRLVDENNEIWDIVGQPREIGRREGWEISTTRREV